MKIEIEMVVPGIRDGTGIVGTVGIGIVIVKAIGTGIGTAENTSKSSPLYPNLWKFTEGANG